MHLITQTFISIDSLGADHMRPELLYVSMVEQVICHYFHAQGICYGALRVITYLHLFLLK